ncbi:MAG TPA: ornithine cyclodeaminase family protein [Sphingomonas sp.]|nr:ornithine cyclodeaminase family protein [Sphingomonas sp.]
MPGDEGADAAIPVIDAARTASALPFDALIAALRAAFSDGVVAPPRHHHHIARPDGGDGVLLLMPAWQGESLGVKIATVFPANNARGLPSVYSSYLLCDGMTGQPLALLDGDVITSRRTIAVSALAASLLTREDASSLLIVGSGRIARLAPAAFAAIRPIRHVAIWNRDPAKAETLAAQLRADGVDAEAAGSLEAAAGQADIISCATPSTEPLIRADWLRPGTHLDLIGSFTPAMREADDVCFARGRVYVDTADALNQAGDLVGPIANGMLRAEDVGSLADLCAGRVLVRRSGDDLTIFKAVGTAVADLVAATLVRTALLPPGNS